ncbi:MAG: hypothetical protein UX38_C0007G0015 [Microgenomates group bacterium GW2011_GWC1_46_16]|uniref:Uncharacterized protein n=1 Tax=Candidatus Collierbacteria bacterium RIFOXYA2_FULL_46_10 TaxID=1817726 RepID=A0A1F5F322_9BACT|nr:MAG: hypothetical protein UX32_C0008G0016 [Microgenomates group bacterium GW2011_GWF1_46_12]KKU26278.1 MAG: hypothetical protein UX38_C0007G0015 [Microgenomates group bacterium GW2011_GWC1_46_16]KKU27645.1 MAG: hypothetical protein UX40_C0009G0015 [Microgenomates group bacterium GW2011_GWF2_46_18]KKU45366.1 MAG: hypothetical protein UX63_C0007G0016 [Microgenomates group bacterium GW2011_GWB1_46_7]KKU62485.1 MAG: hypothetical protein UX84_C0006G0016 [Microgenomates group bacterium GW2011_GWD1
MDELKPIKLDTETAPTTTTNNQLPTKELPMEPVKKNFLVPSLIIVGILAGLSTGYFFAQKKLVASGGSVGTQLTQNPTSAGSVKVGETFGTKDEATFRDTAEGVLQPGGIDGEGSHHIERGANKSQWVYITSSVVDLDMFIGHRVEVWGETNQGKKAGWLMDVGKLKVLELNAAEINNIELAE